MMLVLTAEFSIFIYLTPFRSVSLRDHPPQAEAKQSVNHYLSVILAQARIHSPYLFLDSRLRGNDNIIIPLSLRAQRSNL